MPDHQKRYRHDEEFTPLDYVMYSKYKMTKLSRFDQEDINHAKELIISKVPDMGSIMVTELLLKLGSFLNQNDKNTSGR